MEQINVDFFDKKELDSLRKKINTYKLLLDCLELRLYLIDINKANKNEYEKNEDEITKIITYPKIEVIKDKILSLEFSLNSLLR